MHYTTHQSDKWKGQREFITSGAARGVGQFIQSLKDYAPAQSGVTFMLSYAMEKLMVMPSKKVMTEDSLILKLRYCIFESLLFT